MFSNEELRFRIIEAFVRINGHFPTPADWKMIKGLVTFVQTGEMPNEIK